MAELTREDRLEDLEEGLWALVPGVLVVFLGFSAGGYFAGTTGAAAAALALLLAVRLMTAGCWWLSIPRVSMVAIVGLALYAGWTLLSGQWSHAPAAALLAFDRAVLYLLAVALASVAPRRGRAAVHLRTTILGLAAGIAIVCVAGLLSRTLPDVIHVGATFDSQRLSYPLTYWNALGMLAAVGIGLCVHLASAPKEWNAVRALAAAFLPVLAVTLLLTYSRGAIAALVVLLVVYVVAASRAGVAGVRLARVGVSLGSPTAIAVVVADHSPALAEAHPALTAAISQGHRLLWVVIGCALAASALILVTGLVERALPPVRIPKRKRIVATVITVVVAIVLAGALDAPGWLSGKYHAFVSGQGLTGSTPPASRLGSVSNNGRLALWHVALRGFDTSPLDGHGAGTYAMLWERERPSAFPAQNAHSLYLETLDELGLVGFLPLIAAIGALLLGAAGFASKRWETPVLTPTERAGAAIAASALVAWALHAGVDWDWQVPALTAPVLMLAAAASRGVAAVPLLARSWLPASRRVPRLSVAGRRVIGVGGLLCCLGLGTVPALMAISQAHFDWGVADYNRGRCPAAIAQAEAAISAVGVRPEPYELIGYCDAREGRMRSAQSAMDSAVSLDPYDWEFHYGLALVQAKAGLDPRPELATALRLDPDETVIRAALYDTFDHLPRRLWRRAALSLKTDIP